MAVTLHPGDIAAVTVYFLIILGVGLWVSIHVYYLISALGSSLSALRTDECYTKLIFIADHFEKEQGQLDGIFSGG